MRYCSVQIPARHPVLYFFLKCSPSQNIKEEIYIIVRPLTCSLHLESITTFISTINCRAPLKPFSESSDLSLLSNSK